MKSTFSTCGAVVKYSCSGDANTPITGEKTVSVWTRWKGYRYLTKVRVSKELLRADPGCIEHAAQNAADVVCGEIDSWLKRSY